MEPDYYQILKIPRNAPEKDIKRAYHRLARERHPDKGTTPEETQRLQEEFAQISTAYNVLKDKDKRAEYDSRLQKEVAKQARGEEEPPVKSAVATAAPTGSAAAPQAAAAKGGAAPRDRAAIAQRAYSRGIQLFNLGDYARACEFFDAAINNNDTEAMYYVKLGLSLMRSHQGFNRAVGAIQRAIELDPYNTDHRMALGEIYETVGSTSLAIKTYEEILKWDATNARALDRLKMLGAGRGQSWLQRIFGKLKRR
jgi:curved DNA-binding protein CbpA